MCQGLGPKKHDEISEIDRDFLGVDFCCAIVCPYLLYYRYYDYYDYDYG